MKLSNSIHYILPALVFTLAAAVTLDSNLPNASLGQPYTVTLNPTGGTSPYTHSLTGGSLPPGLSLSGATITGTPQSAGQYSFSVLTTDALTSTTLTNLNLRVTNTNGIQITVNALAIGRINTPYDMTLSAQGGASPYSWGIVQGSGTLPPGITLSSQGRLQGTPTAGGIFPLTIRVTDASGNSYSSSLPLRIEATSLAIATNSLAGASAFVPYSQGFASIGGTPPYTYTLLNGTLPPGLTLSAGGVLSGTPTAVETYNFTIRTTDSATATAQAAFAITVSGSGPRILVSALPNGILNQTYNASLSGQGGTPPYTYSLVSGSLPTGILLNLNGTFSGTPTTSGAYPVTVRIGDSRQQSSQTDLLININSSTFSINNTTAPDGAVNTTYTFA
ncbi:MAG: putative Ig domain-containing protein, partial [Acidobacteria bacterium]|nr:putative Ig domain-containing protein [Acidobacteriota bacterium]